MAFIESIWLFLVEAPSEANPLTPKATQEKTILGGSRNALEEHFSNGLARMQRKDSDGGKKKKELPRATECVHIHWAVLPENYVLAPKPPKVGGAVLWEKDLEYRHSMSFTKWSVECPSFHENYEAPEKKMRVLICTGVG